MKDDELQILLVEDNEGDVRLLQEFLVDFASLTIADRVSTALAELQDQEFDVILLDLSLPDSHGFATFSCMQEQVAGIPLIVLTGNDDHDLAVRAMKHGAQDYLVKGRFDQDLLARSIRYSIERKRLLVEMEKAREHEQHLAYHDVLTGLPNRLLLYDRIEQALVHAKRYSGVISILFIDLDGFKEINDNFGHAFGDRLLQMVADRLSRSMRESDTIARLGGDEFTILLKGARTADDVARAAQKVMRIIAEPFVINERTISVTCSIGISMFPDDGQDSESLIKRADYAMYRVKGDGKNNYALFNRSMSSTTVRRISLENNLRRAVDHNQLRVFFQPQTSLKSGTIIGLEALVRWQHPNLGLLTPLKFVPLAEETGLIVSIGEWVLRAACIQNKILQTSGYASVTVAINLSARQFREIRLPETVSNILDETGLSPEFLMLEITETNAMQDLGYTISTLEVLKEMGVRIALDDFGTGYSSLCYLKKLPIDLIKIDKAFLKGVPENSDDTAIIEVIIALARSLGMMVIAEGVENERQVEFLKSVGCEFVQGFYFSEAVPAPALLELLDAGGNKLLTPHSEEAEDFDMMQHQFC